MKHAKSNTNIIKRNILGKNKKTNNFQKYKGSNYFNTIKTSTMKKPKNYLISLLKNNNQNQKNLNLKTKNEFYPKSIYYKNKKDIYLTSNFNNNNIRKEDFNKPFQRNINIRLNLNSEIINNNFGDYCNSTKNTNLDKNRNVINYNEKIKEKDKLITQLQSELLQMQKYFNRIQKDKQNQLYSTFNTMKLNNNNDSNTNNHSLTIFLNKPSILKFNKSQKKLRNKLYINTGLRTSKEAFKSISPNSKKNHNFVRCFSSSPRVFFPYKLDNIETFNNNNFPIKNLYRKKDKKLRLNYNSNPNIILKKNNKFPSPKSYFTRQLSYSSYEYNKKKLNNNSTNSENKIFIDKCEKLKKRTRALLNKYSILINELNKKFKGKK